MEGNTHTHTHTKYWEWGMEGNDTIISVLLLFSHLVNI